MNGFERRREQKKDNIRRAALELFQTFGFKKVSINDIAQKAGVSKVTIYKHFGGKEEVVRDIVQKLFTDVAEKYRAVIEGDLPFPEKLEYLVLDKAEMAREYQGEFIQTVVSSDPHIRQFVESMYQREINQRLLDFFEEGKRKGYVTPEISQESILIYTEVVRNGLISKIRLLANADHNVKLLRELMSLYLYGVMGKKA